MTGFLIFIRVLYSNTQRLLVAEILQEIGILKVVDLHGSLHLIQSSTGNLAGFFAALLQNFVYPFDVLSILLSALTDRAQGLLQYVV